MAKVPNILQMTKRREESWVKNCGFSLKGSGFKAVMARAPSMPSILYKPGTPG
jgi:hypothetical protein